MPLPYLTLIVCVDILIWDPEWRSGLRHCISVLEVTTYPNLIPGCITTGHDWDSHRAVIPNWPSVVHVRVWLG